MASTINATPTASGLMSSADNSGVLALQTGGTTAVTIDGSQKVTINNVTVGGIAGTGTANTVFGNGALASNTTAPNNTAVGYQAGYSNTTGTGITFVGQAAGYSNTTGVGITCVGQAAGYTNTTGNNITYLGTYAGNLTTGSNNTFVGTSAGELVSSGASNTIIGRHNGNQNGLDIRTASNYIVLSDGSGNPRGVFDNLGNFIVGGNTANGKVSVFGDNSDWNINSNVSGAAALKYQIRFINAGAVAGTITNSGPTTAYNTSSDYRLKESVAPMLNALNRVSALKPVTYKWKADGKDGQGFIAHELAEVFPDAVFGEKDGVDKNGNIFPQGIDTSFLVATLTAAIQEQQALITDLTTRLVALENT